MPSPISPSTFQSLIPTPAGAVCDKLLKALFTFPSKFYSWYSYTYNEDGSFTDDFKTDVCAIDCNSLPDTGGGSALNAPIVSSNGFHTVNENSIKWTAITGAAYYEVVRSPTPTLRDSSLVYTTTLLTFDDTNITASTYYYYFVRAVTATTIGAFSAAFSDFSTSLPVFSAPVVTPTDGPTYITLTWPQTAPAATSYEIRRNTANNCGTATVLGTTSMTYYHDFSGALGAAYYYFVIVSHAGTISGCSTGVIATRQ